MQCLLFYKPMQVLEIYVENHFKKATAPFLAKLKEYKVKVYEKNKSFLDDLTQNTKHQGVVAEN